MGIISWIVFGFIIGLIARALVPGRQSMGFVMTTVLGIAGSLIGGFIGTAIAGGNNGTSGFTPAGFLGSLIGAIVLLVVVGMATGGMRRRTV
jgi:uncharacterized membrane protein YeaQ/YmgE (transglycosylase-associated protein family)